MEISKSDLLFTAVLGVSVNNMVKQRTNRTKPWNTNLDNAEADEKIYHDFEDEQLTKPILVKFKATLARLPLWVEAHHNAYNSQNLQWDHLRHVSTLRIKNTLGSLVIKFHKTTGVVLVQGTQFTNWHVENYDKLKRMVDQLDQATTAEVIEDAPTTPAHARPDHFPSHRYRYRGGDEDLHT